MWREISEINLLKKRRKCGARVCQYMLLFALMAADSQTEKCLKTFDRFFEPVKSTERPIARWTDYLRLFSYMPK